MRRNVDKRLCALEATLGKAEIPRKAFLPEWLMESLRADGVQVTEAGLVDGESLRSRSRNRNDAVSRAVGEA